MPTATKKGQDVDVFAQNPDKKEELSRFIDELVANEPDTSQRGQLIESLHKAQSLFGYLPRQIQIFVAQKLGLHHSDVYGVISFYSYFTDIPQGQYKINVCTGTACFVRGADRILSEFGYFLNIKEGETTEDMKFSLGGLRCVGACSLAPVVMVNEKVYGNVVPRMVPDIIQECD